MTIKQSDFTRVSSDMYGNPRYVIHFLKCIPKTLYAQDLSNRYALTTKLMNKIGGRRFHNKQYGGGIVFQSYSLKETIKHIERIKKEYDKGVKK